MSISSSLSLVGCGYLHHVEQRGQRFIARLNVIQPVPSTNQYDEFGIDCDVNDETLLRAFSKMSDELKAGNKVVVKFTADEIRFADCHYGQAATDPNMMVQLTGRMKFVAEWWVEGAKMHPILLISTAKSANAPQSAVQMAG